MTGTEDCQRERDGVGSGGDNGPEFLWPCNINWTIADFASQN